jgi:putative hydrolase of the HAD superfamily
LSAAQRAVLFDLGNVLVRFDHGISLRALEKETGVAADLLRSSVFSDLERELDCGRLDAAAFFRAAEARAGLPRIADEVWRPAWRDIFEPIPESLDLLTRLAPGVASAIVSNTNALHWEGVLRVCDVDRLVDALALSFEVGAAKPEPRIFAAALERLGVNAAHAVFADDRADYVEAARALGLDAFVVDRPATLEAELQRRDLLAADLFERGVARFRRGRCFEAHEDWEDLWKASSGDDKVFLQGLIQLAAGCVHLGRGRPAPAARLARLALEKLRRAGEARRGLDLAALVPAVERLAARLEAGETLSDPAKELPLRFVETA